MTHNQAMKSSSTTGWHEEVLKAQPDEHLKPLHRPRCDCDLVDASQLCRSRIVFCSVVKDLPFCRPADLQEDTASDQHTFCSSAWTLQLLARPKKA
jgi:hypothetical protein